MTTATLLTFTPDSTTAQPGTQRAAGVLLIAQWVLMIATLAILTPAINWPASLDNPAGVMLPLLVEQRAAVAVGYTSYLLSALLLIPIALLLAHLLRSTDHQLVRVATGLGVLAGLAKLIGIGRWLFLMPALANAYSDPQTSAGTREALAVTFDAFNAYAGGIGEVFGVMLLAGLWTALISLALLRSHRRLGIFGLLAAALLLLGLADVYGVELGPILIIQGVVWQFWMLALGIVLVRGRMAPTAQH